MTYEHFTPSTEVGGLRITDEALEAVRDIGFAVVDGFLTDDEVASAREAMFRLYPSPEEYFADPEAHSNLVSSMFAGLSIGPFDEWALNRIAMHEKLIDAAQRFCGTTDIELYKMEAWAKYGGSYDYDQPHHYDFDNHNLVLPRRDQRWPQLTTFLLLSDVTRDDGPTMVVPRTVAHAVPYYPNPPTEAEALRAHEVAITGSAGALFMYSTDVLHRGSRIESPTGSRFVLLADYQARGQPWLGKVSWPGIADRPVWNDLLSLATPPQRAIFGFPPPGHEYWNSQTLLDLTLRWPKVDMTPYLEAAGFSDEVLPHQRIEGSR